MEQLPLDLGRRPALGREAFLVTESNRLALEAVEGWRAWPGGKLALIGPAGAGKTHLAHVWAELSGAAVLDAAALPEGVAEAAQTALVIEDVDRIATLGGDAAARAEEQLLHLHNATLAAGGHLLLTGSEAPARWAIGLPDLASRLAAAGVARLAPPDDALLAGVLVKLFADRQIRVSPKTVEYLVARIERSVAAAEVVVAALDAAALARGRPVGRRLAAELLGRGG